jgi:uncharacterized protein YjbI with pentapeptide repeats
MITSIKRRFASISDGMVMGILIGFFSGAVTVSLIAYFRDGHQDLWAWTDGFAQNFGTEMFGAFLTFLLIEVLIGARERRDSLAHQLSSAVNTETKRAAEELRTQGWLTDGTLRNIRLAGANLEGANLSQAVLSGTDFIGANLSHVNLHQADLRNTSFVMADLSYANLEGALMHGAQLDGAYLRGAQLNMTHLSPKWSRIGHLLTNLEGAQQDFSRWDLSGANLREADLRHAVFTEATLYQANLSGANLSSSDLSQANLWQADLSQASLTDANLYDTSLQEADLAAADLRNANCLGTSFRGANLAGTNLQDAQHLTEQQLRQVHALRGAILPDGSRYDGQFNLPGDIALASESGLDVDDAQVMARFYAAN